MSWSVSMPSFFAAAVARRVTDDALREAHNRAVDDPAEHDDTGPEQALTTLLLLRQIRERLATWESGLIPAPATRTGRVQRRTAGPGSRERRAADRSRTARARGNAAEPASRGAGRPRPRVCGGPEDGCQEGSPAS